MASLFDSRFSILDWRFVRDTLPLVKAKGKCGENGAESRKESEKLGVIVISLQFLRGPGGVDKHSCICGGSSAYFYSL